MAVLLVIANHVVDWPVGGFIGVDVFFVISGFLITGLLLREHDRTGRISLKSFYLRRVKRILPAALTVTVATIGAGFVLLSQTRFESLVTDGIWATLFAANWRQIAVGTDYMNATSAVSPLQHFWSLSIEEQFYFVWPVLLIAVLMIGFRRPRRVSATVMAVVAVLSFGFSIWESSAHPTSAYFSTFSRTWELAAGAFLAIAAPHLAPRSRGMARLIAWAGLAVLTLSALFISPDVSFPGPYALLPVLGASAIIVSGLGSAQAKALLLTNPVLGYIGNLSYSLYLWHFPVIVFSALFLEGRPRTAELVALCVTAVLSIASYHLIENPIRTSGARLRVMKPAVAMVGIVCSLLLVANFAPIAPTATADVPRGSALERSEGTPATNKLWEQIDAAVKADVWPALTPSIDSISSADLAPEWVDGECLAARTDLQQEWERRADGCVFGDSSSDKIAVLVGDSVAVSWAPAIRAALEPRGYSVHVFTAEQCPPVAVIVNDDQGTLLANCDAYRDWALTAIGSLKPDITVMSYTPGVLDRLHSGATAEAAAAEWRTGLQRVSASLKEIGGNAYVLEPSPSGDGFDVCATKRSTPADCMLDRTANYENLDEVAASESSSSSVRYIETTSWFCSETGYCPSFTGGIPVLVDGYHLTGAFSKRLGDVLSQELVDP